jgi:hypothetical protein
LLQLDVKVKLKLQKRLATVQVLVSTHIPHTITKPQAKDPLNPTRHSNTNTMENTSFNTVHKIYLGIDHPTGFEASSKKVCVG